MHVSCTFPSGRKPDVQEGYDTREILTASIAHRVTIMSIDCQHDHTWVIVRRWAKPTGDRPSGESRLFFAGKVTGGVEESQRIQRKYDVQSMHVILDVAHFTNTVCNWIVENGWRGA